MIPSSRVLIFMRRQAAREYSNAFYALLYAE
jgi:hypothetical protein